MSVIVRYTAESQAVVNENGRQTEPFTDHGDLTVKIRNRWTENFPDENVCYRRQGYLPKLVTKINAMPTTFEGSVVK